MEFLTQLWLPIVASAAAVWIASSLAWMVIGHHKKDWKAVPGEQEFIENLKRMGIPPGNYGFPEFRRCDGMSKEEKHKLWDEMQKNPMGLLRVWGPISMGRNMLLTFIVILITSTLLGYVGWNSLGQGGTVAEGLGAAVRPGFAKIMQVLGTAGVLAYCMSSIPNDIWFQRSGREILMNLIDGVAYGLITGAIFGWLWPK
ncbi:MAG TPA: hypothetical protein VK176_06250 [Phycisphaerales bacterium]|nr:hypothetical protein [Phycisphaerales bacterium]